MKYIKNLQLLPVMVEDAFTKCDSILQKYDKVMISVSGGSDSDIVVDMVCRLGYAGKCSFVFFDTGIEYQATKDHLQYLEDHYSIQIERIRPKKPVPSAVREVGVPFLTKYVSGEIGQLQGHNFEWEDLPLEQLQGKYGDYFGFRWWTNYYPAQDGFKASMFQIAKFPFLKEFLIKYPPEFPISDKCCKCAKKDVSHCYMKNHPEIQLRLMGVRKSEGGIRAIAYKGCYYPESKEPFYMPLFWMSDADKREYEKSFEVVHSACYTVYGMKRTGCAGCPFNSKFLRDIETLERYEPKLAKAVKNIFGKSYEYTLQYREFKSFMKAKQKQCEGQMTLFDED